MKAEALAESEESLRSSVNHENGSTSGCSTEAETGWNGLFLLLPLPLLFLSSLLGKLRNVSPRCEPVTTEAQAETEGRVSIASVNH